MFYVVNVSVDDFHTYSADFQTFHLSARTRHRILARPMADSDTNTSEGRKMSFRMLIRGIYYTVCACMHGTRGKSLQIIRCDHSSSFQLLQYVLSRKCIHPGVRSSASIGAMSNLTCQLGLVSCPARRLSSRTFLPTHRHCNEYDIR